MNKEKEFEKFLQNIEPSKTTKEYISSVHNTLRKFLENHEAYKKIVVETFLSGSYAKHTCIRPSKDDEKIDVDIIVVTTYNENDDSKVVLNELYEICKEKYQKVTKQNRSVGVELEGIEIDIVPVIKVDGTDMYKIGNKKDGGWKLTNPKGHIEWCTEINQENEGKFVRIVKMFKWWRKKHCPLTVKYPKGITLEKIIADNLFDCSDTYENIVLCTMKNIKQNLEPYVKSELKPFLADPGILTDNLSDSYEFNDFKSFYNKLNSHINFLENESLSNESWREILGTEFPKHESTSNNLVSSLRGRYSTLFNVPYKKTPFWTEKNNVALLKVKLRYYDEYNNELNYEEESMLKKNVNIDFNIEGISAFSNDAQIYWQVVNTGEEARRNNCLRGNFEIPNITNFGRHERTAYTGIHWVQAFVVKENECIAKSEEVLVKIK